MNKIENIGPDSFDYTRGYDDGRRSALREVYEILESVLKLGHGSGNWESLVLMARERVENI